MGKALQMISGYRATNSATLTQVTYAGTDTGAVQYFDPGSHGYIIDVWADINDPGTLRLRSPNLHDNVNGINLNVPTLTPTPVLPADYNQHLVQNDTITIEIADNGTAGVGGISSLWYYDNLPGANANLFRWEEIRNQVKNIMGCKVSMTVSGTRGTYVGSTGITATQNQFHASANYALLGYETNQQYQSVGITGPDTSNRRVGGPGTTPDIMDVRQWFIDLSKKSTFPCIPVFNQQNLAATVVDVIDTENKGNGNVTLIFAELNS